MNYKSKGKVIDTASTIDKRERIKKWGKIDQNKLRLEEKYFLKYKGEKSTSGIVIGHADGRDIIFSITNQICTYNNLEREECGAFHIKIHNKYVTKTKQMKIQNNKIFLEGKIPALEEYYICKIKLIPMKLVKEIFETYSFEKICEKILWKGKWGGIEWISIPFKKKINIR